jgi:exoribonuclease-2
MSRMPPRSTAFSPNAARPIPPASPICRWQSSNCSAPANTWPPPGRPGQGHFGLAVHDYAHTTAPNRRFPDLVMQRLVKAALAGTPPPYTVEALAGIARHCTLQEGRANAVERQVLKAAAAFLLDQRIGEVFDAVVTGVAAKGTFVRLRQPLVEGRVVQSFEGLDVGDTTRVRLVAVDAHRGHIDFEGWREPRM